MKENKARVNLLRKRNHKREHFSPLEEETKARVNLLSKRKPKREYRWSKRALPTLQVISDRIKLFNNVIRQHILTFGLDVYLKVHKHDIFFLTFFAETESLWSQGSVTRDF